MFLRSWGPHLQWREFMVSAECALREPGDNWGRSGRVRLAGNVCSVSARCPGSKNGSVNLPAWSRLWYAGLPPPTLNILQTWHHSSPLSQVLQYRLAFPLKLSTQYWGLNYHQFLRTITKSLLTLRGEWFIINSLYLHRAWEFHTNSTDWQTFTMMAWEQDFPAIFDKLLKQFNVSIIHWRSAPSVWK